MTDHEKQFGQEAIHDNDEKPREHPNGLADRKVTGKELALLVLLIMLSHRHSLTNTASKENKDLETAVCSKGSQDCLSGSGYVFIQALNLS